MLAAKASSCPLLAACVEWSSYVRRNVVLNQTVVQQTWRKQSAMNQYAVDAFGPEESLNAELLQSVTACSGGDGLSWSRIRQV